ncbi:BF3164 family lipoprotein [Echinicola vietnamensis]|nr:BF3164 family lipoprotein [Echinicola vietnamensis]
MRKLSLLMCLLLLFSCTQEKEEVFPNYEVKVFMRDDIPNTKFLKGEKLDFGEFLEPRYIMVNEDYILVCENGLNDIFYVYDKEALTYVKSMGKDGFGPGEISRSNFLHKGLSKGDFWVYDNEGRTFNKFNLYNDTNKLAVNQIKQTDALSSVTNFVPITDSTFMAMAMDSEHKFLEYNWNGGLINTYGKWEHMSEESFSSFILFVVNQGKLIGSADRIFFGICGVQRDYIDILNRETGKVLSIRGPENIDPEFEISNSRGFDYPLIESDKIYYRGLFFGKSSIFALYCGFTDKESIEKQESRIFEFDYRGNILNQYFLDNSILSFTVDEEEKKFYCVSFHEEDPNVVLFSYDE